MRRLSETLCEIETLDGQALAFYCPACVGWHTIPITGSKAVPWNEDAALPTIHNSMRVVHADGVCHYSINAGMITYLSDSTHNAAGLTLPLPSVSQHME